MIFCVVQMAGITAAHVHHPRDRIGHPVETDVQTLHAIVQRPVDIAGKQRLIHLDVSASSLRQRADFEVQRIGQIMGQLLWIVIKSVRTGIHDRGRPRNGDLDRTVGKPLRHLVIPVQKMRPVRFNLASNRRQFRGIGAIAQHPAGQVYEVKPRQVAAMVMDVVFPPLFPVRRHLNITGDLIFHRRLRRFHIQSLSLCIVAQIGFIGPARHLTAGGGQAFIDLEPVPYGNIIRLGIRADTGRGQWLGQGFTSLQGRRSL